MSERRAISVIILYNDQGRFLLQHRTSDAPRFPNYWGLFGGGAEGSESPEEALRRELKEELDYIVQTPKLLCVQEHDLLDHRGERYQGTRHVFIESFDMRQTLTLGEGQAMAWLLLDETKSLLMGDPDRELLQLAERMTGA